MWHWWWSTQLGDVRELALEARGDGISVLGNAGELDLGDQGVATAYNPVVVGDADFYEDGESIPNRAVAEASFPESVAAKICLRQSNCRDKS